MFHSSHRCIEGRHHADRDDDLNAVVALATGTLQAAIDRGVHHSVILEFDIPSYRTNAAQQRVQAEAVPAILG